MPDHLIALAIGFVLDLILGDPEGFCHPVILIGRWISFAEKKLKDRGGNLRRSALLLTGSTVLLSMLAAHLLIQTAGAFGYLPRIVMMSLLDWMGLAATSLARESAQVAKKLDVGLPAARQQLSRIVGRDTQDLGEQEIICAAVETVAENTTDGVISPMLYAAIGGPVLLWGFKAASTLDSMVGYMDDRHRDIGWSSARLDDVLNFVPARLTAFLLCISAGLTGQDATNALRIVRRDHTNHLSPNCAWSEAAAAGALHIRLGGTHYYGGLLVEKPTIGDDERPVEKSDILRTNRMMYVSAGLCLALLLAFGWIGGMIR